MSGFGTSSLIPDRQMFFVIIDECCLAALFHLGSTKIASLTFLLHLQKDSILASLGSHCLKERVVSDSVVINSCLMLCLRHSVDCTSDGFGTVLLYEMSIATIFSLHFVLYVICLFYSHSMVFLKIWLAI